MSARHQVPLIVLPEEPGPIPLPSGAALRTAEPLTANQVSLVVCALAVANVLATLLLTSGPVPRWLGHRFGADLETGLLMGSAHVGLSCCVILFAGRALFRRHGLTARLYAVAGAACLGTAFSLGRLWTHPPC